MLAHIGLDDTDTIKGGCTTYVATEIIKKTLPKIGFLDYPRLIRLNPNIPWKTKGNAAIAISFTSDDPEKIFNEICGIIENQLSDNINAGTVLIKGNIPSDVKSIANEALFSIVKMKEVKKVINRNEIKYAIWGKGSGIKGALAAVGNTLNEDHTYELLTYRSKEKWGSKREIINESVYKMDKKTHPLTFNNYDYDTGRVLITPNSPDPVFFGIRGESPQVLLNAFKILKIGEKVERYVIYRTNQGTGIHLKQCLESNLNAYRSGYIKGMVTRKARIERGGHLFIPIKNSVNEIMCAVYEPSGSFRKKFIYLEPGDIIEVGGGIRKKTSNHPSVLNVEYLRIIRIIPKLIFYCKNCKKKINRPIKKIEFKCQKCGKKQIINYEDNRQIKPGLFLPPARAQRHLTKPINRFGIEKKMWDKSIIRNWCRFKE